MQESARRATDARAIERTPRRMERVGMNQLACGGNVDFGVLDAKMIAVNRKRGTGK